MKKLLLCVVGALTGLAVSACVRSGAKEECPVAVTEPDGEHPAELPLPLVPDSLTDPVSRADFILYHFWAGMDFSDTALCRDTAFMEQNFVNFINLYGYGSEKGCASATRELMRRAAGNRSATVFLTEIAEKYLYEPNSPMRNETSYIFFLREFQSSSALDEGTKSRFSHQLADALKNRPGFLAADFHFIERSGRRMSLHSLPPAPQLLLVFYDPDCETCKSVIDDLARDEHIAERVATGELVVLALDAESDRDRWEATCRSLPADWLVGFNTDNLLARGLYVYAATPTLYLLDKDKRVLAKDIAPEQLLQH